MLEYTRALHVRQSHAYVKLKLWHLSPQLGALALCGGRVELAIFGGGVDVTTTRLLQRAVV